MASDSSPSSSSEEDSFSAGFAATARGGSSLAWLAAWGGGPFSASARGSAPAGARPREDQHPLRQPLSQRRVCPGRPLGSHARHALETTKSVATARRPWCPQPKESSCPRASQALQARHHASPPAGGTRRQRAQDAIQRAARSHLFEPVANSGGVQFHSLSAVGILMHIYIYIHTYSRYIYIIIYHVSEAKLQFEPLLPMLIQIEPSQPSQGHFLEYP